MLKNQYTVFSVSNSISQVGSCILYKLHTPNAFEHFHHTEHIAATLTCGKKKNQKTLVKKLGTDKKRLNRPRQCLLGGYSKKKADGVLLEER